MNIVLLLNNDIASNLALNLLLAKLSAHKVSVFLSSKVGGHSARPAALQDLAKFEQHDVYQTLSNEQTQNNNRNKFKTYPELAEQYGVSVEFLNNINSTEGLAKIQALAPDIMVSVRYGVILKNPLIALAKHGVINLHSGLLPDYRGVMATFWALANGDKTLASTLHFIDDSRIDTGRIIANSTFNVQRDKSYLWHVLSLYVGGCELITQAIDNLNSRASLPKAEQVCAGEYYTFPTDGEVRSFMAKFGALYQAPEIITLLATLMTGQRDK